MIVRSAGAQAGKLQVMTIAGLNAGGRIDHLHAKFASDDDWHSVCHRDATATVPLTS